MLMPWLYPLRIVTISCSVTCVNGLAGFHSWSVYTHAGQITTKPGWTARTCTGCTHGTNMWTVHSRTGWPCRKRGAMVRAHQTIPMPPVLWLYTQLVLWVCCWWHGATGRGCTLHIRISWRDQCSQRRHGGRRTPGTGMLYANMSVRWQAGPPA